MIIIMFYIIQNFSKGRGQMWDTYKGGGGGGGGDLYEVLHPILARGGGKCPHSVSPLYYDYSTESHNHSF